MGGKRKKCYGRERCGGMNYDLGSGVGECDKGVRGWEEG